MIPSNPEENDSDAEDLNEPDAGDNSRHEQDGDVPPGDPSVNGRSREKADSGDSENEEGEEPEVPPLLHALTMLVLVVTFLSLIYIYARRQGYFSEGSKRNLAGWQETANEIIKVAVQNRKKRIPYLIEQLSSDRKQVRRNAVWALHHLTGLPWGEKRHACLKWWRKHGNEYLAGESPSEPPPGPERFSSTVRPNEINLEVFLQLRSDRRIVTGTSPGEIQYEVGISNRNRNDSIHIYSPDELPYRAYRYLEGGRKIPVHTRYSPSVMKVTLLWFDPEKPNGSPIRRELLEYRVFGRADSELTSGETIATASGQHLRKFEDVASSPHSILKLRLEPTGFLVRYRGNDYRVTYKPKEYVIQTCRKDPDRVPGLPEEKLEELRDQGSKHDLRLSRVERMYVTGYTWNTNTDGDGNRGTFKTATGARARTGGNSPANPRTYASHWKDVEKGTLLYDTKLGWGKVQDRCGACKEDYENGEPLSRIDAFHGKFPSREKALQVERKNTGSRWILIFEPADDG